MDLKSLRYCAIALCISDDYYYIAILEIFWGSWSLIFLRSQTSQLKLELERIEHEALRVAHSKIPN